MAAWIAELRSYNRIDCGSLLYATWTAEARRGWITLECEKTAKGHKAAPLCTPLGLFYIVQRLWNAERN